MPMHSFRLNESSYRLSAPEAAPFLLGKLLCRRIINDGGETLLKGRITETEAYYGETDSACHAHRGKTPRTQIMYGAGGAAYIYLCYGIHELFNVVTGPENHPEAVLIRAIEDFTGPGKLTKALGITRDLNGENLILSDRLWIEDDGFTPEFTASKRIGINYANITDINRLWRFTTVTKT